MSNSGSLIYFIVDEGSNSIGTKRKEICAHTIKKVYWKICCAWHAIVSLCLKGLVMRNYIISRVGTIVQSEVATLCIGVILSFIATQRTTINLSSSGKTSTLRCESTPHISSVSYALQHVLNAADPPKRQWIAMCTATSARFKGEK